MRDEEIRFTQSPLIGVKRKEATKRLESRCLAGAVGPDQKCEVGQINGDWFRTKRLKTTDANELKLQIRILSLWGQRYGRNTLQSQSDAQSIQRDIASAIARVVPMRLSTYSGQWPRGHYDGSGGLILCRT